MGALTVTGSRSDHRREPLGGSLGPSNSGAGASPCPEPPLDLWGPMIREEDERWTC